MPSTSHATDHPPVLPPLGDRPLPTLVALLPFLLVLEYMLITSGDASTANRVLAHERIGETLHFFGLSPIFILHGTALLLTAVLLIWQSLSQLPWRMGVFEPVQLVVEGIIGAAPLLAGAAFLGSMQSTPLTGPVVSPTTTLDLVAVAIGAGLSEEFLFRMVGILAVHALLTDVFKVRHSASTIIAVLATAAAFTLYHNPSSMPDTTVAFVAAAGVYLGALYVLRGFAVAVIAHIGYDLVALLG